MAEKNVQYNLGIRIYTINEYVKGFQQLRQELGRTINGLNKANQITRSMTNDINQYNKSIKQNIEVVKQQTTTIQQSSKTLTNFGNLYLNIKNNINKMHNAIKQSTVFKTLSNNLTKAGNAIKKTNLFQSISSGFQKISNSFKQVSATFKDTTTFQRMQSSVLKMSSGFQNGIKSANNLSGSIKTFFNVLKNGNNTLDNTNKRIGLFGKYSIKTAIQAMTVWSIAGTAIFGTIRAIRKAFKEFIEVQEGLIDTLRIFGDKAQSTGKTIRQLGNEVYRIGIRWSASAKEVNSVVAEFARMGLSIKDAMIGAEAVMAITLATGAEATEVIKALGSIMAQWGLETKHALLIFDQFVTLEKNFANTTAQDVADAFSKASSLAQSLGIQFNELGGIVSALTEAMGRSGSEIGNSLKTIFARFRRDLTDKILQDIAGISTKLNASTFDSFINVMDQLAIKWQDLTDTQRSAIAEQMAGVRQIAVFENLINNWTRAIEGANDAQNSMGEILRDAQSQQEAYSKKLTQMQTALGYLGFNLVNLLAPALTDVTQKFTQFIVFLSVMPDRLKNTIKGFLSLIAVLFIFKRVGLILTAIGFSKIITNFALAFKTSNLLTLLGALASKLALIVGIAVAVIWAVDQVRLAFHKMSQDSNFILQNIDSFGKELQNAEVKLQELIEFRKLKQSDPKALAVIDAQIAQYKQKIKELNETLVEEQKKYNEAVKNETDFTSTFEWLGKQLESALKPMAEKMNEAFGDFFDVDALTTDIATGWEEAFKIMNEQINLDQFAKEIQTKLKGFWEDTGDTELAKGLITEFKNSLKDLFEGIKFIADFDEDISLSKEMVDLMFKVDPNYLESKSQEMKKIFENKLNKGFDIIENLKRLPAGSKIDPWIVKGYFEAEVQAIEDGMIELIDKLSRAYATIDGQINQNAYTNISKAFFEGMDSGDFSKLITFGINENSIIQLQMMNKEFIETNKLLQDISLHTPESVIQQIVDLLKLGLVPQLERINETIKKEELKKQFEEIMSLKPDQTSVTIGSFMFSSNLGETLDPIKKAEDEYNQFFQKALQLSELYKTAQENNWIDMALTIQNALAQVQDSLQINAINYFESKLKEISNKQFEFALSLDITQEIDNLELLNQQYDFIKNRLNELESLRQTINQQNYPAQWNAITEEIIKNQKALENLKSAYNSLKMDSITVEFITDTQKFGIGRDIQGETDKMNQLANAYNHWYDVMVQTYEIAESFKNIPGFELDFIEASYQFEQVRERLKELREEYSKLKEEAEMKERFEILFDLDTSISDKFQSLAENFGQTIEEKIIEALSNSTAANQLSNVFANVFSQIDFFAMTDGGLGAVFTNLATIGSTLVSSFSALASALLPIVAIVIAITVTFTMLKEIFAGVVNTIAGSFQDMMVPIRQIWNSIKAFFFQIGKILGAFLVPVFRLVGTVMKFLTPILKGILVIIAGVYNTIASVINFVIGIVDILAFWTSINWRLPYMDIEDITSGEHSGSQQQREDRTGSADGTLQPGVTSGTTYNITYATTIQAGAILDTQQNIETFIELIGPALAAYLQREEGE